MDCKIIEIFYLFSYRRATEDLKSLSEEEKKLDLKVSQRTVLSNNGWLRVLTIRASQYVQKLWVDLGILSDETARRHIRRGGHVAGEEIHVSLKEDKDLLQAQSLLTPMLQAEAGGESAG